VPIAENEIRSVTVEALAGATLTTAASAKPLTAKIAADLLFTVLPLRATLGGIPLTIGSCKYC
jgi:hypothetical protein